ncbi:hypothetical protein Igag_1021 [Ignisphaera aggregans DSM 17230]|uniref:V-type ATP synthase subunit F n=1 Tax=Ignisphaera aggregans (strain DSM 17230 / JCM 13409 / AQ1.S1) TaxID=583356 RepID=E0SNN9_IGNAA|nr:hypothetical protein Igag_1021 [Ignisphaera aggregans DSM 17230]
MKVFTRKIAAIVDKRFSPLMRILGIDNVYEVDSPENIVEIVKKIYEDRSIGIVIVQQSFAKYVMREGSDIYPIFIAIPDSLEYLSVQPIEFYRSLVRRYIGYEIYIS